MTPDFEEMQKIQEEASALRDKGLWTLQEYKRLLPYAKAACAHEPELIEAYVMLKQFTIG